MLQNIRSGIQGTLAKVIIAIIIIPFALFGIDSLFGGGGGPGTLVKVNGDAITEVEFNRAINLEQRRLIATLGDQLDPAMLSPDELREPVLSNLVRKRLMLQAAADYGMTVSDDFINQSIVEMPEFQEDGQFSPVLFQSILRAQGMSASAFRDMLREEILIQQLRTGFAASAFSSDSQLATVARLLDQRRSFSYMLLDAAEHAPEETPPEQLQAYYETHIERYQREEQLRLSYIELHLEDFFEPVRSEDIRAAFAREVAAVEGAASRLAAHILLEVGAERDAEAARQQALSLRERIQAGEDFSALAAEYSDDLGSRNLGGELGYTGGDVFPEPFERALAELKVGEVSAPVRTDAGYHLILLADLEQEAAPEFEERRAAIERRLQRVDAEPRLLRQVETLRDLAFNSDGLELPAEQLQLELRQSDWVGRSSDEPILADARVMAAAFSRELLEEGFNSDVIELSPEHFIVVHVEEHRPAEPLPFAQVEDRVREQWRRDEAQRRALAKADEVMAQLRDGASMGDIAGPLGLEWQRAQEVGRNSFEVDEQVLDQAFRVARPEEGSSTFERLPLGDGRVVIIQLDRVDSGSLANLPTEMRRGLSAQISRSQGESGFAAYLSMLRERARVERL